MTATAKRQWLFLVLLAAGTFCSYLPALRASFIWDDDAYVTKNSMLREPDGLRQIWFSQHKQSQYFPLVFTTFRIEYALWGLNPVGYHAVNILLHIANAMLIWAVLRRLMPSGALLAAAFWALHPVQVESVAWITELKNTQSTLFYLLALLCWMKFVATKAATRRALYVLALLFCALALLSKTTACTLPAALLLVSWWQERTLSWRRIGQALPFLFMGIAMGLVSIWWEGHLGNYAEQLALKFGWLERVLIATRALWFYIAKLVWPANLAFSYPKWAIDARDLTQYAGLAGCAAVGALLWMRRGSRLGQSAALGLTFFAAALSPLLGFIWLYTFRYTFVADHYQYVACIGPLALAAAGLNSAAQFLGRRRRFLEPLICGTLLLMLGVLTWRQSATYLDSETLWRATIKKSPRSAMAYNNLGQLLFEKGALLEAPWYFQRALELDPDNPEAHNNLGTFLRRRQLADAILHFQKAAKIAPNVPIFQANLGSALAEKGLTQEAITHLAKAVALDPAHPFFANNLAWLLATSSVDSIRDGPRAVELAQRAVDLTRNGDPVMMGTLAAAYAEAGRFEEAIATVGKAQALAQSRGRSDLIELNARLEVYYRSGRAFHGR